MRRQSAKEILEELKSLGRESYEKMLMNNYGVKEPCFGVKIGEMKRIQKRIKKDYQLALDLYETSNYDAMYFAGLIADDSRMTPKDLQRWVEDACAGALPGATVAWVAAGSPHGWEIALKWIRNVPERRGPRSSAALPEMEFQAGPIQELRCACSDQHHKLSLQRTFPREIQQLRRFAPKKLFKLLRQFARQHHGSFREDSVQFSQQFFHAIG